MNRLVQYLNLIGVIALAALCVAQWKQDRQLNLDVNRLEKTHQEKAQKIAEQEKTIRGLNEDLAQLKEQFSVTYSNLTDAREILRKGEGENARVLQERDQLKESVTNWVKAVAVRDERLKESNERIVSLSQQLNDSIRKFNTLASNYNSVVKQLDEARLKFQAGAAEKSKQP